MYIAEISLTIFKFVGIWPPKCSQGFFTIYHVFTIVVAYLMFTFASSNALYLLQENYDVEKFSETFFNVMAITTACVKMIVIFQNRLKITEIMELLLKKEFAARDNEEAFIQNKFDKVGRVGTIIFVISVFTAVSLRIVLPLMIGNKTLLPFNVWVPYNLENRLLFWLTFTMQSIAAMVTAQATAASDTLILVMMLQLCAQIEILIHRIEVFSKLCKMKFQNNPELEQIVLGNWIEHHSSLYQKKLNEVFSFIFLFQLFSTTLEVCTSTYLLTTFSVISMKFWSMILSFSCVMFQVGIYCWHGQMIIEKSRKIGSAAFNTEWISLTKKSRISLIHIIKRSNTAIELTAGPIFPLSIDTFNKILRLSYSIYNFLK